MKGDTSDFSSVAEHLLAYTERNVSHEVQKAIAITIMATAISQWGCSILEAANRAADCCGLTAATVRQWAFDYSTHASTISSEDITDEYKTEQLVSNCGSHDNHTECLGDDEDFQLAARMFVRKHACRKGESNMTCKMFTEWIEREYKVKVHNETARRWLSKLGFSRVHHQKGVYFDGHDRVYRNEFIAKMTELDKISITDENRAPEVPAGEKPLMCSA